MKSVGTRKEDEEENILQISAGWGEEQICLKVYLAGAGRCQWETLTCSFRVIPSILGGVLSSEEEIA